MYVQTYLHLYICTYTHYSNTVNLLTGFPRMTHRHDKPLPLSKNLVCIWHGRSIGALSDHLGFDVVSIGSSNDLLPSCRDKHVTLVLKEVVGGILQEGGEGEPLMKQAVTELHTYNTTRIATTLHSTTCKLPFTSVLSCYIPMYVYQPQSHGEQWRCNYISTITVNNQVGLCTKSCVVLTSAPGNPTMVPCAWRTGEGGQMQASTLMSTQTLTCMHTLTHTRVCPQTPTSWSVGCHSP